MNFNSNEYSSLQRKAEKFYEDAEADLRELSQKHLSIEQAPDSLTQNLTYYKEEYLSYRQRYEAIRDASFWKMTAPLRKMSDVYRYIRTGKKKETDYTEETSSYKGTPRIGVHLHLYYEDLLQEFCSYLNNIPETFDLYISCKKGANQKEITRIAEQISHVNRVVTKESINRGRDIAPFYVLFRKELQQYPYLLHIHSKKSLYTGNEKSEWRHWALDGVLKNCTTVKKIIELLENKQLKTGLVFGEMNPNLPLFALHWLHNTSRGAEILGKMGFSMENTMLFYPVGSFFWVKREAIQPLFDLQLNYKDFEEEHAQIDGTLAHALERVIARIMQCQGYNMYIFDQQSETFSLNKSYKSLSSYLHLNVETVIERLSQYEVITFDIFDTLITRLVYQPDDVFRLMERILKEKHGIEVNFLKKRKDAEALAWKEKGDFCNIHDIYEKLPEVSGFSKEEAQLLKEMEFELELKLCIPRRDVLNIYHTLIKKKKRIILISDMYLPADMIEKLLTKCGFVDYEELWISCEKGKRKDRNTIWDDFLNKFGQLKTIHVGDNPHSDCQLLSDRGRDYLLLLSSAEQFRFSKQYENYHPLIKNSVENSIILGYMVNECLYNSPFAINENGVPYLDSPDKLGRAIYGPLFLTFCEYLHKTSHEDSILLFLAREGYFFQKLYKKYCEAFHHQERENHYFLASRRAASVAQIDSYSDAKDLLKTNFSGKISTLFTERYGLNIQGMLGNEMIKLPEEMKKAVKILQTYRETLLKLADDEKTHYLRYIHQELGETIDWKRVTLVDLGYAGTIQYYLMKIIKQPLDACYMITDYQMKPEKQYGTYRGLYSFWKSKRFDENKLFLESVAAAPHGQVVRFETKNGMEQAILKEENAVYGKNAMTLQEPIYHYIEDIAILFDGLNLSLDKNLAECIFSEMLQDGALSNEMQGMFIVADEYCADGKWIFDEEKNKWILKKDI